MPVSSTLPFLPPEIGLPPKFKLWRPHQERAINQVLESGKRFIGQAAPTGCHPKGQKMLMLDGSLRTVESIKVGDRMMGPDSHPRIVKTLIRGYGKTLTVSPIKGVSFGVTLDHVLTLASIPDHWKQYHKPRIGPVVDVKVSDYLEWSKTRRWLHKLFRVGVEFPKLGEPPLDPYFMGILIGDGSLVRGVSVSKPDEAIRLCAKEQAEKFGLRFRIDGGDSYHLSSHSGLVGSNPVSEILKELGLFGTRSGDKFIPSIYKLGSRNVRLAVLAGILDTDGHLGTGCYDYISKSGVLARDVDFLCRSLGFSSYLKPSEKYCQTGAGGVYYRVSISGDLSCVPCRIPRKQHQGRLQIKDHLRTGFEILDDRGDEDYYGFTLSGDGRYLLGDFTVTHNSGKSASAITQALIMGGRVVYLTSTKGLQSQLMDDFSSMGLVDVRGRQNYQCHMADGMSCEDGFHAGCRIGSPSSQDRHQCPYAEAVKAAKQSSMVVTNYAYWMAVNKYGDGLGPFDLMVCDEGHDTPDEVSNACAVEFSNYDAYRLMRTDFPPDNCSMATWKSWASALLSSCDQALTSTTQEAKSYAVPPLRLLTEIRQRSRVSSNLKTLIESRGEWVAEPLKSGWRLEPLWPSQYAESVLFRGIPKIVIMSATLTIKTLDLLGIPEEEREFEEYPSTFPGGRWPVWYVPTCRVDGKMGPSQWALWMSRIDQILAKRRDRKGIIHTVSYARRDKVMEESEYSRWMMTHERDSTVAAVELFKKSGPGTVLVSPSMTTGWDFPGPECAYQILAKVPFPDRSSRILQAREESDPEYALYLMSQALVQSCGRGMRSDKDRCEQFIIDDHIRWILKAHKGLFPNWWRRLYRRADLIPMPPPPL